MMYIRNEKTFFEAEYRLEMLNLIRREKFDFIMPEAMKDNDVDMWIHVIRRGSKDPFSVDFGADKGYFIFTDTGGNRIERALFGYEYASIGDESIYDVLGKESDIKDYVAKHNPRNIAVNISQSLTHFDSLSYTGYSKLCDLIGEDNSKKIISGEKVITEFRAKRVHSEIVLYSRLCEIQRRILEKGLRNIIPGKTSRREVALFGHGELIEWGLTPNNLQAFAPNVMYSANATLEETEDMDYIFQKGDFFFWDWGYERVNINYGIDFKRNIYLLKDGEVDLPIGVKSAWRNTLKARDILKQTVISGRTARKTMELIVKAIEDAGFIHTPFESAPEEICKDLGKCEKPGFSIDFHTVGNAGTDYEVGAAIAPQRQDRADIIIPRNQFIAFEFMINQWIPEWNERVLFDYEENVVITPRGCEFIYPRNEIIALGK